MGNPTAEEINGNLIALNALAGIPLASLKGFRAPLLEFTADTLKHLSDSKFLYDSSASASVPVTATNTDAYWPYTLDNGLANNCDQAGLCNGEPKLPGLWEIPMYAFFDNRGVVGPHLMDPWLCVAISSIRVKRKALSDVIGMQQTGTARRVMMLRSGSCRTPSLPTTTETASPLGCTPTRSMSQ
jgi:hypothetical protein